MKLITSIFGKASNITEEDIKEKIVNSKMKEDSMREYKEIRELNDGQKDKNIIQPLVGFVNALNGNGLLILGIKDKNGLPVETKPVDLNLIKNEEQIRAIIISSIATIPSTKEFCNLSVIRVPINKNGSIFLIEIERTNEYCVCYSTISQCAYLRRNDETLRLSLLETIDLIKRKNFPKVFVYFGKRPDAKDEYVFDVAFKNEGLKPGRYITTLIKLFYERGLDLKFEGQGVRDVSNLNLGPTKTYQIETGYPPVTQFVHPTQSVIFGKLKIPRKKDFELKMVILTWENEGRTIQEVLMLNKNGYILVQESLRQFIPYLGI